MEKLLNNKSLIFRVSGEKVLLGDELKSNSLSWNSLNFPEFYSWISSQMLRNFRRLKIYVLMRSAWNDVVGCLIPKQDKEWTNLGIGPLSYSNNILVFLETDRRFESFFSGEKNFLKNVGNISPLSITVTIVCSRTCYPVHSKYFLFLKYFSSFEI